MILPTWEEAQERCILNQDTPLDRFIYDNEPAGKKNEAVWRSELEELCEYVLEELPSDPGSQRTPSYSDASRAQAAGNRRAVGTLHRTTVSGSDDMTTVTTPAGRADGLTTMPKRDTMDVLRRHRDASHQTIAYQDRQPSSCAQSAPYHGRRLSSDSPMTVGALRVLGVKR